MDALTPFSNLLALALALGTPLAFGLALERGGIRRHARERRHYGRIGLSLLLLLTASAHFTDPSRMASMLPAWIAGRQAIVLLTGLLEIALALALWVPRLRRAVGWSIVLMLGAFLPANIFAALERLPFGGNHLGPAYLLLRVPFQLLLIGWTLWVCELLPRRLPLASASRSASFALLAIGTVLAGDTATLRVSIVGAQSGDGVVRLTLFDSAASFLREPYREASVALDADGTASAVFDHLPFGDYALSAIHDANGNGQLDTNFMRVPTEPYAFSNGARSRFGPADYADARFEVDSAEQSLSIAFD